MTVACESMLTPAHVCVGLGASVKSGIIEPLLKIVNVLGMRPRLGHKMRSA